MSGTLFIVATPIGNLEDITYRAVRILGEADCIACEDTRQTRKLLQHYEISKPLVSYHEHNEASRTSQLLDRLQSGESVALVSDAGTPLISDPGYRLVAQAREAGIPVVPIPGPSAIMAALSAAGLPTDSFAFLGFAPPKTGARQRLLEPYRTRSETLVLYEAPHRILETLRDIQEALGPRPIVLARELTKLHEEFLCGEPASLIALLEARPSIKGEFTVLIGKSGQTITDDSDPSAAVEELVSRGFPRMDAIKQVARERGLSKRDVYRRLEKRDPS